MGQTTFEVQWSKAKIGVQVQLLRNEHFQCPFDIFCNFEKLGKCVFMTMILQRIPYDKNFQD